MINSFEIAMLLSIDNRTIKNVIQKYQSYFLELGTLFYKNERLKHMGRYIKNYTLNKHQLLFLISCLPTKNEYIDVKKTLIILSDKDENQIIDCLKKIPERNHRKGYVYLIENDLGHVKIGRSINPDQRIANQITGANLQIRNSYISEATTKYGQIEKELHKKYKINHLKGEWFNIDFVDVRADLIRLAKM